ncbi:winged helix-turn-helix domain-containing protein [Pseudonocardia petroleophila]|uniref:Winged helix-turn-helix transcriptional regulator n=1 Tax=Pseudonocardia petroleophila TaxID=37331 RepID=A0A7G7MN03_9PSEU|nr:metalloregulator ArsR/SmtB family transcription factor [Pseudonocardia petroleophila]QNG54164.1 winged helix-turn-helix transcriptional regulator [Pseudonocardia petroleophila]
MDVDAGSVAAFAALLADRTRAGICLALIDGRAWTAGELAAHTGVARSTASEHLTALVSAGLLAEERQGRHRYVRLAGPGIAALVEDLAGAVGTPRPPVSLRSARAAGELSAARTCYDHLAGALGVALFDALVGADLVRTRDGLALTGPGREWFTGLAGETALWARGSRPLLRTCLDWTERRPHLGGRLGAVLHRELLRREWVVPLPRHRAVRLTPVGATGLADLLGRDLGVPA